MSAWMGRVRMTRFDGECEHYETVELEKRLCDRCYLWFLACPKCKPRLCPSCRNEKPAVKKEEKKEKKVMTVPYYKRHKEKCLERMRLYRMANPEKAKEDWERRKFRMALARTEERASR